MRSIFFLFAVCSLAWSENVAMDDDASANSQVIVLKLDDLVAYREDMPVSPNWQRVTPISFMLFRLLNSHGDHRDDGNDFVGRFSLTTTAVPEPASFAMLGGVALCIVSRHLIRRIRWGGPNWHVGNDCVGEELPYSAAFAARRSYKRDGPIRMSLSPSRTVSELRA